jgi:hypothetical protein
VTASQQAAPGGERPAGRGASRLRRSRRGVIGWIILIVIVAAVAFLLPLPFAYSGTVASTSVAGQGASLNETFANGASISGTWSAPAHGPIAFSIVSDSGTHVYTGNGVTGTYSFTANGGTYRFYAVSAFPENVSVSGTSTETAAEYVGSL